MKILDKIMRLFGYENINNIKIPFDYTKTPPSKEKMKEKRKFYRANGKFMELIVITKSWCNEWYLKDGYTSFLIAKENNIKYVKVVRTSKADKMFEKLGYTVIEKVELITTRLVYKNPKTNSRISFCKEYHVVLKTLGIYPKAIDMQELKAINKKCEELGWI